MPILSWITGWVNCSGWVALVATGGLLGSQLVLGVISLMNPVGYLAFTYLGLVSNYCPLSGLRGPALAPVFDLRCLQPCRIRDQRSHEQNPPSLQQGCL
jgi:hypothetical protein